MVTVPIHLGRTSKQRRLDDTRHRPPYICMCRWMAVISDDDNGSRSRYNCFASVGSFVSFEEVGSQQPYDTLDTDSRE